MLILSRRSGERIRIGDHIEVIVRRVSRNRVTLAIEAPRDVSVLRGELEQYPSHRTDPAFVRETQTHSRCPQEPYFVVEGRIAPLPDPTITNSAIRQG